MNGLWMLVAQAKESAEWFTGAPIDDNAIASIHSMLCKQMQNIVLVGMPGCGKSTIGKLLAERLGKQFVDSDASIVAASGMTIPEIFAQDAEMGFRAWESSVLEELGKQSGLVIATGGGCVTKYRNYPLLHQNGTIIWLQRDLDKLPTEGRPLSQTNSLTEMYTMRKSKYRRFADHTVDNNGDIETTLDKIMEVLA